MSSRARAWRSRYAFYFDNIAHWAKGERLLFLVTASEAWQSRYAFYFDNIAHWAKGERLLFLVTASEAWQSRYDFYWKCLIATLGERQK